MLKTASRPTLGQTTVIEVITIFYKGELRKILTINMLGELLVLIIIITNNVILSKQ